jgi:uncharacterized SAM-binding protein YcdF (DUF218 family)
VGVAACLVGVLAVTYAFPRAGAFLVVEDPFAHAEIALVLSGLPLSRSFAARDLYHEGRVDHIVVIPEPPRKIEGEVVTDQIKDALVRLGLFDPSQPQWAERILVATGVPRSKIALLPESVDGTIREAPRVRAFLKDRLPKRLVVITSKSASRRARLIFRHVFRKDRVQIVSYPTPYDSFEPRTWWSQPRNALTVVTEYEKLFVNMLTLAFRRPD